MSDFAEALANPIKYQSELEKRAEQLAVLTEDMEPITEEDSTCNYNFFFLFNYFLFFFNDLMFLVFIFFFVRLTLFQSYLFP